MAICSAGISTRTGEVIATFSFSSPSAPFFVLSPNIYLYQRSQYVRARYCQKLAMSQASLEIQFKLNTTDNEVWRASGHVRL